MSKYLTVFSSVPFESPEICLLCSVYHQRSTALGSAVRLGHRVFTALSAQRRSQGVLQNPVWCLLKLYLGDSDVSVLAPWWGLGMVPFRKLS